MAGYVAERLILGHASSSGAVLSTITTGVNDQLKSYHVPLEYRITIKERRSG